MEAELSQARGQLDKSSKDHKRQIEDERKMKNKEVSYIGYILTKIFSNFWGLVSPCTIVQLS